MLNKLLDIFAILLILAVFIILFGVIVVVIINPTGRMLIGMVVIPGILYWACYRCGDILERKRNAK